MDESSDWELILTDGWGPLVLDAVVRHVEQAALGDRARLVRTVTAPDDAPADWVEWMHALILEAIRVETGADLEALGSQGAWACYEQTWDHLGGRWARGGRLVALREADAPRAREIIARLPVVVAAAAGADTSHIPAIPLTVDGVVHVDAEGIFAWIAERDDADASVRRDVDDLVALARAGRSRGTGAGAAPEDA